MKLILQRKFTNPDWMSGSLSLDGQYFCRTIEDELRATKVAGETAIPAGTYAVTLQDSPKFGPDTVTLLNVPGFTYVRIHSGRSDDDTEGCIVVGDELNEALGIISGGIARGIKAKLQGLVKTAIEERGEEVTIEIKNAPGDRYVDTGELVAT